MAQTQSIDNNVRLQGKRSATPALLLIVALLIIAALYAYYKLQQKNVVPSPSETTNQLQAPSDNDGAY